MEDDLKMIKVKYPQILDLGNQTKIKILEMNTTSNGRRPQSFKS